MAQTRLLTYVLLTHEWQAAFLIFPTITSMVGNQTFQKLNNSYNYKGILMLHRKLSKRIYIVSNNNTKVSKEHFWLWYLSYSL